jgi:hypothetical protein
MRVKKAWFAALVLIAFAAASHSPRAAADQTWAGMISDSMCKDDHGGEVDPKECTAKCVRNGDKYVLMTDGYTKAMAIANQNFPDLAAHAGQTVKVTGELQADGILIKKME